MTLSLLAALPGACVEKGEETTPGSTTDTSGDSTGDTTDDSTGDSTGDTTGATSGDSSSTGEPTTGDPTTEDPTTGDPTTDDPTTGEPSAVCIAYVEWVYGCELGEPGGKEQALADCEQEREATAAIYGADCAVKSDTYVECLSKSACDDFDACEAESEATDVCLPEAGPTCKKFGANVSACVTEESEEELASGCQFEINLGAFRSEDCGAATEALYGCYGGLTCAEIEDDGAVCSQQEAMAEVLCPDQGGGPVKQRRLERQTHRR